MNLILASTSPYRKQLLSRLQMPFTTIAPGTDESPLPDEPANALVERLALAKALAVAKDCPDSLIIGSDQVAALNGQIFGKPGNYAAATAQLSQCSGMEVVFYTAIALVGVDCGFSEVIVNPFTVKFRELTELEISTYLQREQPYDCAGSFKCEGLGIALFESLSGSDPTSLEGLPLIALTTLLANAGYPVLTGSWA
ncbi:MAG: Maf family nucleotide pyrophosphatase [Halioglobus sp.]